MLSFELKVTHQSIAETRTYYGQNFTQENSQTELGDFFTPVTLNGYSSASHTVCFYPIGREAGNLFSEAGVYEFEVIGKIANVKDKFSVSTENSFQVTVDEMIEEA